jgi:hypothetical protein
MLDPDFIRMTKKDLPKAVHFEVVGSRGVLGEEERTQKMSVVTAFAAGNQLFAPLLDSKEILIQMFQDAGVKNPERFLLERGEENVGALKAKMMQMQQALQKVGGMLQQEKSKSAVKMAEDSIRHAGEAAKARGRLPAKRTEDEDGLRPQAEAAAGGHLHGDHAPLRRPGDASRKARHRHDQERIAARSHHKPNERGADDINEGEAVEGNAVQSICRRT